LLAWTGEGMKNGLGWFYSSCYFYYHSSSNGANLTDGIDGLAAGTSAISVLALGILLSFLEILFSLIIYICISQFWVKWRFYSGICWIINWVSLVQLLSCICIYGIQGSLTIRLSLVLAIAVRKELLIPYCAVFFSRKFICGITSY
jgi:phospho-N-acetylmuramoyl-pentapeptide-transferase